jgi:hypothetical protein
VGNGEHGSSFHQSFQGFDDQSFRFGVQGCRRFVENQDWVIAYDRARDADTLPLATGKGIPPVADERLIAIGHAGDELVRVGQLGGLDNLLVGGAHTAVRDVIAHGSAEEHGLLQHIADLVAQGLQSIIAHIDAVDQNLNLVDGVTPIADVRGYSVCPSEESLRRISKAEDNLKLVHQLQRLKSEGVSVRAMARESGVSPNNRNEAYQIPNLRGDPIGNNYTVCGVLGP